MRLKGITAPSFIRPRLRGWGFSVVEALIRSINQYLKATDLSFEVLDEFKLDIFKVKNLVNTLLSPNGDQEVRKRVALANWQKNYQNAMVMDSEDDYVQKQLSFAGLAEAMGQIRMQVASDMRMPLTKLFGISATGFNSGEDDIEVYNSMVESQVRNKIKYIILRVCEIKCQKLFGFIPDDLSVAFKPLRVLSAEQEETVKTQKFTRLIQAKERGEINTLEFRDACNKGNLFDITLDTDVGTLDALGGGYMDDAITEGANQPKGPATDSDDPGANRVDTRKPTAQGGGGISKEPPAPKSADAPDLKGKAPTRDERSATRNASWKEDDHPRADDGKFGSGGGKQKKSEKFIKADKKVEALGARYDKNPSEENEKALKEALKERASAMEEDEMPKDIPTLEKKLAEVKAKKAELEAKSAEGKKRMEELKSKLKKKNSTSDEFDKVSFEADGGDLTFDMRRKYFFDRDKAEDKGLWDLIEAQSRRLYGKVKLEFIVWMYKKEGGIFI
jgi:hypothetical protein